ncbi:MAG: hypothetical protein JNL13_02185 [Chitinophagaceae bacterium]|nr:hypothetical protein [Chitinophagaceae bacterium]
MIQIRKEGLLLKKTELSFENEGVLNPGIIAEGRHIHIFYRAVSKGNFSSIGYCLLDGPMTIVQRRQEPLVVPEFPYEAHGIEDPRIVKIENLYYLTYTAYDGVNAHGALAVSEDLLHFEKKGIITPQTTFEHFRSLVERKAIIDTKYIKYNEHIVTRERDGDAVLLWDKNLIFFPRRIGGKLYFLHRIKPDMQLTCVYSLDELTPGFWEGYFQDLNDHIVMKSRYAHESAYLGGGAPPVETPAGWLLIYHGVEDTPKGYIYSACAALLDLEDPQLEIARLPYPLFFPQEPWELEGEVNNVCFPTGTAIRDDRLYIYYGAADEQIAVASVPLQALLDELLLNKKII